MKNIFWNDVLRYSAILGVGMGLSKIYETYELFIGGGDGVGALFVLEWFVVMILFVVLLYKFTKRHSQYYNDEQGFSFATGMAFVVTITMLTGVIVGVMEYIFISIVGYESFVEGYLSLVGYYMNLISESGLELSEDMVNQFVALQEAVRKSSAPSMLDTLFAALYNYSLIGVVLGLIIAAIVRRGAVKQINQQ